MCKLALLLWWPNSALISGLKRRKKEIRKYISILKASGQRKVKSKVSIIRKAQKYEADNPKVWWSSFSLGLDTYPSLLLLLLFLSWISLPISHTWECQNYLFPDTLVGGSIDIMLNGKKFGSRYQEFYKYSYPSSQWFYFWGSMLMKKS